MSSTLTAPQIRSAYRLPPNKFIRIIRLNKAKELLANPSQSIAAIALDCGYNDPGYFARVFKQEFGVTPQEWR